jgi:D-alanine transfer protein
LKTFFKQHFFPLAIALFLCALMVKSLTVNKLFNVKQPSLIVSGKKVLLKGCDFNFDAGKVAELNLVGSLSDKTGITIFGSSELSNETAYIPYNYLADTLGIRVNAFGHAFHQSYAIYAECLAMSENLNNAKICIIVSPSWFETNGTNIQAFLEFVRPNFLRKIICDKSISRKEKAAIGEYLYINRQLMETSNNKINQLVNCYKFQDFPILNNYIFSKNQEFGDINYKLIDNKTSIKIKTNVNWKNSFNKVQNDFLQHSKSNNIFIADSYYELNFKNGHKAGNFSVIGTNNQEFEDFSLLLDLLEKKNANVSIVIQNLNPYHYSHLYRFNPTLNKIVSLLNAKNIPFLNMFTPTKKEYIPGTLNDVMHTGDLGWLKINKFIVDTYYAEK